jgi:hypothetical protein
VIRPARGPSGTDRRECSECHRHAGCNATRSPRPAPRTRSPGIPRRTAGRGVRPELLSRSTSDGESRTPRDGIRGGLAPSRGSTPRTPDADHRPRRRSHRIPPTGRPVPGCPPVPVSFHGSRRVGGLRPAGRVAQGRPARRAGHVHFGLRPPPGTVGASTHEGGRPWTRRDRGGREAGPARRGTHATGNGGSPASWDSTTGPATRPRPRRPAPGAPRPRERCVNDQGVSRTDAGPGHPRRRRAPPHSRGRTTHTIDRGMQP